LRRIASLDGFRAISIILVIISHSRFSYGFPFSYSEAGMVQVGLLGVTIFFVISGFLITNLLLVEEQKDGRINIKHFYLRRFFRIVPVYGLYIIFAYLFTNTAHLNITMVNFAHMVTFTTNFYWNAERVFQHFWSLSVEEQFYFIWPAILIFSRNHLKIVILIFLCISPVTRVIAYKFPSYSTVSLGPFFNFSDSIFIGALGGILYFKNQNIVKEKFFGSWLLQLLALGLIILFEYLPTGGRLALISLPFGTTIISFSILFLIVTFIHPSENFIFKILNYKAVVHIGVLSYSIYIWQQFFFLGNHVIWRTFPFNIAIVYLVALASYYLWEKPFLKIKQRYQAAKLQPKPN